MLNIRINTDQIRRFEARAAELSQGVLNDFDFESLVPAIQEAIQEVFKTEGDGEWPPLSERYAAQKARTHPGAPILVRSGLYLDAATSPGHTYNFIEITDRSITYGVDGLPYPAAHEYGVEARNLPARPVFTRAAESTQLEEQVNEIIGEHINSLRLG